MTPWFIQIASGLCLCIIFALNGYFMSSNNGGIHCLMVVVAVHLAYMFYANYFGQRLGTDSNILFTISLLMLLYVTTCWSMWYYQNCETDPEFSNRSTTYNHTFFGIAMITTISFMAYALMGINKTPTPLPSPNAATTDTSDQTTEYLEPTESILTPQFQPSAPPMNSAPAPPQTPYSVPPPSYSNAAVSEVSQLKTQVDVLTKKLERKELKDEIMNELKSQGQLK